MRFDAIPIWVLFAGTIIIVMIAMDVGYRLGRVVHRRAADEKESAVSVLSGGILGLAAFMLAFTFSMASGRFDTKKALVREDANAIRTAWLRSDFLPEPDRAEAAALLLQYVDVRIRFAEARSLDRERVRAALSETQRLQDRLWTMAVANVRRHMDSEVGALYIDALNEMSQIQASRVAVAIQARIPLEIWLTLYGVTILGMMAMGYQTAIAESKRSSAQPLLALSFALVIVLIASLDRPDSGVLKVKQQPLIDLRETMADKAREGS
jgi:hypothetical protein